MKLDDARWEGLEGGYRVPYDPRPALQKLATGTGSARAWSELWNELHHQGDVGEASYAAIPALVQIHRDRAAFDWNLFALAAVIEVERHRTPNPPLPRWLAGEYHNAWQHLTGLALGALTGATDRETVQSALAVVAIARGELKLGALLILLDSSEVDEILVEQFGWPKNYPLTNAG